MTCFVQLDIIMNSREMTKCGQKLEKKISFTVTVLLCQLFSGDTNMLPVFLRQTHCSMVNLLELA